MGENEGYGRRASVERGFAVFKTFGKAGKAENIIDEILIKLLLYNRLVVHR